MNYTPRIIMIIADRVDALAALVVISSLVNRGEGIESWIDGHQAALSAVWCISWFPGFDYLSAVCGESISGVLAHGSLG